MHAPVLWLAACSGYNAVVCKTKRANSAGQANSFDNKASAKVQPYQNIPVCDDSLGGRDEGGQAMAATASGADGAAPTEIVLGHGLGSGLLCADDRGRANKGVTPQPPGQGEIVRINFGGAQRPTIPTCLGIFWRTRAELIGSAAVRQFIGSVAPHGSM